MLCLTLLNACNGDDEHPATSRALVSVAADSNSPTQPPATVTAKFNTKIASLGNGFFQVRGTCSTLPVATPTIGL